MFNLAKRLIGISNRFVSGIFLRGLTFNHNARSPQQILTGNLPLVSSKISKFQMIPNLLQREVSTKTLQHMHNTGPLTKKRPKRQALDGRPQMKGVVLKTLIKKPKKPNSANRKCVLVRLSNGKEKVAFVPGIGHNLQEHNVVLCESKRLRDTPGVKIRCIRGKYDLAHVVKQKPT